MIFASGGAATEATGNSLAQNNRSRRWSVTQRGQTPPLLSSGSCASCGGHLRGSGRLYRHSQGRDHARVISHISIQLLQSRQLSATATRRVRCRRLSACPASEHHAAAAHRAARAPGRHLEAPASRPGPTCRWLCHTAQPCTESHATTQYTLRHTLRAGGCATAQINSELCQQLSRLLSPNNTRYEQLAQQHPMSSSAPYLIAVYRPISVYLAYTGAGGGLVADGAPRARSRRRY